MVAENKGMTSAEYEKITSEIEAALVEAGRRRWRFDRQSPKFSYMWLAF